MKEFEILQEFRDCFCSLFLNKKFYSNENTLLILDDYFCLLKSILGSEPYKTIITKEMLLRILSFSDLLLKQENESIITSYILLLNDFMKVVKQLSIEDIEIKQDESDILNYYCDKTFSAMNHTFVFYNCIKILYENNLVVDLSEENQKKIIELLCDNYSETEEIYKDKYLTRILTLLILCVFDIYSMKPTFIDFEIFRKYKSSSQLIKILLYSFIPLNKREELFDLQFKSEQFPISISNLSDNEPNLKLKIFALVKYHFTQLTVKYRGDGSNLQEVKEAEEMIKCVISSLSTIDSKTEFFQLFFNQNNDVCSDIFIEMFMLREAIESKEINTIVNHKERENSLLLDIAGISQKLITVHPNCFIYRFLNELIAKNQDYYTNSIVDIVRTTMNALGFNNKNGNNVYLSNLSQILVVVYNMSITEKTRQKFFEPEFKESFCHFIREIQKSHVLYSRVRINENNKMICEMLFDILVELHDFTKMEEYLKLFGSVFFVNTKGIDMSTFIDKKTIPKDVHSLMFFLDSHNLKEYASNPLKVKIEQIEKIMLTNISEEAKVRYQKIKVNYSLCFMIKIMYYLFYKKGNPSKNIVSLLSRVLYEDILYLHKKHSLSNPSFYSSITREKNYNDLRKAIEDIIKYKTGVEGIIEWFAKTRETTKIEESLTDYKHYFSYKLFFSGRTHSEGSYSESNQTRNDSSTSWSLVGSRTLSSPKELYQRAMTDTNYSQYSGEYILDINETGSASSFSGINKKKVQEEKPKKKRGFFDFFRRSKREEENEEEPINSITSAEGKKRKNTSLTQPVQEKRTLKCFDEIHSNNLILCPKKEILLTRFGMYYKNIYFSCPMFKRMKQKYLLQYLFKSTYNSKQLDYPTKLRNFSDSEAPPMFLKLNHNFYSSEYFPISHSYAVPIVNKKMIKHIPFVQRSLDVDKTNYFNCELINVETSIYGGVKITDEFILFEDAPNDPRQKDDYDTKLKYVFSTVSGDTIVKKKQVIAFYSEIKEVLYRRFLYIWQAAEIFLKDGKSYFLNFFSKEQFDLFIASITPYMNQTQIVNEQKAIEKVKQFETQWVNNKLSNYDYLLKLNKYSTRTYKETNQYPVFPWVIRRYNDLINPIVIFSTKAYEEYKEECQRKGIPIEKRLPVYRDMKYPISLQTEEKRESAIKKYNDNFTESLFPCHLGNHYSTSSYVYYYLMRIVPFMNALIKLQNNIQENPNRMFDSLLNTQIVLDNSTDSRELIPEFYTSIEFMINLNCAYFGEKSNKKIVDDIINKTDSLEDYTRTLFYNRKILNDDYISQEIVHWINYVFGVNQLTNKAEACNIFSQESYAQMVNLKKDLETLLKKQKKNKDEIYKLITDKINLIINFGQSPLQIFNHPHPKKNEELTVATASDDIEFLSFSMNEGGQKRFSDLKMIYFNCFKSERSFYGLSIRSDKTKSIALFSIEEGKSDKVFQFRVRFSLGEKIRNHKYSKDNRKFYLDSLDYAFKAMECKNRFYLSCRYLDNSFKVHRIKKEGDFITKDYSIYTEDFVNAIEIENNNLILIGLRNGKLIEYSVEMQNSIPVFREKRFVLAHEGKIRVIEYSKRLNIIITAGDDNMIYIRKAYNFELLTTIKVERGFKIVNCKLSELNFLYVFCCNYASKEQKNVIIGYTINGIEFARSKERYYTNFDFLQNGNIVTAISDIEGVNVYELIGYSLEDKKDPTIPLDYNGKQITVKVNYVLVKDYYLCMLSKQRAFNWSNIEKKANE